jgi:hypothetical protein
MFMSSLIRPYYNDTVQLLNTSNVHFEEEGIKLKAESILKGV